MDRVSTACKIRLQPGEDSVRNFKVAMEMGKESIVINGTESCTEVKGNDNGRFAGVRGTKDSVQCVNQRSFG